MCNVKFLEKLKKTYKYYKSLSRNSEQPKKADAQIRTDAIAFLTCPYPVLESETEKYYKID